MMAYPYLKPLSPIDDSFESERKAVLSAPKRIELCRLVKVGSKASVERMPFETEVKKWEMAQTGWGDAFVPTRDKLMCRHDAPYKAPKERSAQYAVRFVGNQHSVDILINLKTNTAYFFDRGDVRPFFAKDFIANRAEVIAGLSSAFPNDPYLASIR
ncbi:MAG: hypothetical protein J0L72_02345 [Armatimonadetes bacterium]|nr:hypothetical protein [Armatimonadota bacterium]